MPKTEIFKFDRDYTKYSALIKSFESTITSKLNNEKQMLYYLSQYTFGKPLDIVRTYMHLPHDKGYKEAIKMLHKR